MLGGRHQPIHSSHVPIKLRVEIAPPPLAVRVKRAPPKRNAGPELDPTTAEAFESWKKQSQDNKPVRRKPGQPGAAGQREPGRSAPQVRFVQSLTEDADGISVHGHGLCLWFTPLCCLRAEYAMLGGRVGGKASRKERVVETTPGQLFPTASCPDRRRRRRRGG